MESFESMLNLINESLRKIQGQFDIYQNEFFPQRPPEFFCLELNGEAGELANAEKKRWKGRPVADEIFADEAADVLIALMNYSNARKIDLGQAVSDKLKKIEAKRKELAEKGEEY
jgi:NTP pyrophosphatase (non-canonical NTP hydrolase)